MSAQPNNALPRDERAAVLAGVCPDCGSMELLEGPAECPAAYEEDRIPLGKNSEGKDLFFRLAWIPVTKISCRCGFVATIDRRRHSGPQLVKAS
jgi:hypothetical protein